MTDVYGEVGEDESFIEAFCSALYVIDANGVENAMLQYIQQLNKEKAMKDDKRDVDASPAVVNE